MLTESLGSSDSVLFFSSHLQGGLLLGSSRKCFVTVFLPKKFWKTWTGLCSSSVFPENPNLINMLCVHLVREHQEQDAHQGKGRWQLSTIVEQAEAMASLAREQWHSTQTGRVTAARAEPADHITRKVYSDEESSESSQEYQSVDQS